MIEDGLEGGAISGHACGAELAESELMAADEAARMAEAIIAGDGEVGVAGRIAIESFGVAAAGRGIECGQRRSVVFEDQAAGFFGGARGEAMRIGRGAEKLAMGGVAEIVESVAGSGGGVIRSGGDGLGF